MLQTKADVSKDILENITLGRFIRENRVEKNQDGMKWHAFKVGKFFMKHPVSSYVFVPPWAEVDSLNVLHARL